VYESILIARITRVVCGDFGASTLELAAVWLLRHLSEKDSLV
jgi:hypothetical protein